MNVKHWFGLVALVGVMVMSRSSLAAPTIGVTPGSATFPVVRTSGTATVHSSSTAFMISNTGSGTLMVSGITFTGGQAGDFSQSATFPITLGSGASQSVTVTFNPSATGTRSTTMAIASNDAGSPTDIPLTGTGGTGIISVTSSINFGTIPNGTSSSSAITISNTGVGSAPLVVTGATITPASSTWFSFAAGGGCTAGSTSCTFSPAMTLTTTNGSTSVLCAPPLGATGTQTATVTFASDTDPGGSNTTMLSCTAGPGDIVSNQPSLAFGNVLVNSTSSPLSVTLTNDGMSTVTITSVSLAGTNPGQFSITTNPCTSNCALTTIGSQTFSVACAPASTGSKSATLHVVATNADNSPFDVPLTCTGVAPHATPSATSLNFGNVELGSTSATQTLTVMNTGTADLHIKSATFTSGSAVYGTTSGLGGTQSVVAGGMTSWTIDCTPAVINANPGNFEIVSDSDAGTNVKLDVMLACTGQAGVLSVSPASVAFGGVRIGDPPATKTVTLSNMGNVAVTNITAMLSNTTVGYSITSPAFPTMLAAGASVTVTIQFAPMQSTDGGTVTATFAGVWGASSTPNSTVLTITGQAQVAGYDTNPHTFAFPDERFDQAQTTTIVVTDTGTSAVNLMSIALNAGTAQAGDFQIVNVVHGGTTLTTAPYTVSLSGMNDTATVTVKAGPLGRVANSTTTLHIVSDLPTNPDRDVPLSVNGTTAVLNLTPAMVLDFGAVDLAAGPITQTITVLNTGSATLNTGTAAFTGSPTYTIAPTTVGPQAIAPGAAFSVDVTYTPTVAKPPNNFDTAQLTFPLAGLVSGPPTATIQIQGRGITRVMTLGTVPTFPSTFRNPGDKAPVMPFHIMNSGEATLSITAEMLSSDPEWTVVNAGPVDIPGNTGFDYMIKFAPTTAGKAPDGVLMLVDNDRTMPMGMATFSGEGMNRNVNMGPSTIDLGFTGVGIPVKLSQLKNQPLINVTSMDPTNMFTIRSITVDGDGGFTVTGPGGDPPDNIVLAPNASEQYDVEFAPTVPGDFTATATLYLDMDPTAQAQVTLTGHALFVDAKGGAGCSVGGGAGGGMVLVIGALVLARRRRQLAVLAVGAVVIATGVAARAAPSRDLDLGMFDPTPETTGNEFELQSATVGANGDWVIEALASYANDPLVLSTVQNDDTAVKNRTMFQLGGAYAFLGRFEAGLHMPLYVQSGDNLDTSMMFGASPATGTATGDLTLHAKALLWRGAAVGGDFALALGGSLTLPTATKDEFAGVANPEGRLLALASLVPSSGRLTLNVNAGAVLRAKTEFANIEQGSGLAWGVGGSYRVIDPMWAVVEVFGELVPSGQLDAMGTKSALNTVEALGGIRYQLERRASLGVALGRGVADGIGVPDLRGVVTVTFAPSAGVIAPIGGFVDETSDRDGDGIPDYRDKCPDEPEDKDMFQDQDGCPDPDNDNDGIPDAQDKCPLDPEDKDGFQDADGCPDPDNDNDGIPDAQDKCPNDPEDKDGYQDLDGCPDPDNDGDGIPDAQDKCPNDPETINGIQDDDGCPDKGDSLVMMSPDRVDLLEAIQFNGTKLAKSSFNLLGQVAATLRAHSEVVRVRVTAYVQPTGNADKDQELSVKRAIAVRDWLVQWGIKTARLDVRGFGSTKPLVPASQHGSQAINDRVELVILERK